MVQQATLVLRWRCFREAESRKAVERRKYALRGQGKGEGDAMGWEVQCLHLSPSETPRAAAVPLPGDAQRRPASTRAVGAGERAGSVAFCCCRVIYDMRESHCLDPSCIFPRALPLFPDPRCAPATVRLLWGCSPCRGYAGQCRGGLPAAAGPIWSPEPAASAQPPGGPADVPRAWEWGFRPIQVHGHRRHSAAGGAGWGAAGSGAFGSILPSLSALAMSSVHTDPPSLSPPDKCAHK